MKKYLSLIGALALGATSSLSVIACGPSENPTPTPNPGKGEQNVKEWTKQTSNIAKTLILSKNANFNTNRLLNSTLNSNENNIINNSNENTGTSYENFKKVWGYNEEIDGITEEQFNSDSDSTFDNNLLATKQQISETVESLPLGLLNAFSTNFKKNNTLYSFLNSGIVKGFALDALWSASEGLNGNSEIIDMIKQFIPVIESLVTNLDAFNPEATLGEYYDANSVTNSLFGTNGDNGWLHNYKTFGEFTSEAITQGSSILDHENFKDWDEVALFKSSIDLNGLVKEASGKTLGEMFSDAITYNEATGQISNLDINKLIEQFQPVLTSGPENIIKLIATLIPVIKTEILDIKPTTAITKITTKEETNKEEGIINLTDLISSIENIFLSEDGFANFISNLFFSKANGEFNLGNYATFDITYDGKPISEVLSPIKDDITSELKNLYTEELKPLIQKFGIKDIFVRVKEILASLEPTKQTEITLSEVKGILGILKNEDIYEFIEKLSNYESKEELDADWMNLWSVLGLQEPDKEDFVANSTFDRFAKILLETPNFLGDLDNLLKLVNNVASDSIDIIIKSQFTTSIDFTNEKIWGIDETTITHAYNEATDETTISYNLADKTNNKVYQVSVVVKGNAESDLGTTKQQVWLQSLNEAQK